MAGVAGALAARPDLLPAERVVGVVARCDRIVVRTRLMLIVPFAVLSIGFLLTAEGVLLRDFARSHGDVPLVTMFRVLVAMEAYVLFLAAAVGVQRAVWNRHPDLFAAHQLLRAIEQMSTLRTDAAGTADGHGDGHGDAAGRDGGGDVDVGQVRQDVVAMLGQSARYVRRLIGRRLPFVGREELVDVRLRATELAQAISGHQKVLVYGSRDESMRPAVDRTFRPDDIELLRREVARIYTSSAAADQVLSRLEYPREQRPNIDYHRPDVAWQEIFHDLELGIVEDPYRRLLAGVFEMYNANLVLVDLAHRYDLPVPSRREPLRRITGTKRWLRRPRA
ncbi:effector-associated domain EAD1-containing protein [Frankia tisae]|uniref:effector-associated domain EAD1-containing protein n=1 Tax=Frankia tisae TaxID=2950104 RepID=UPI0021C15F33|nr:effector-associated domain EAD1-containing protein [Frankia tisae]